MNKTRQVIKYLISDFIAASLAWTILFLFRKLVLEPKKFGHTDTLELDTNFYLGLVIIPLFWISLYALTGQYYRIYRRHRLKELAQVFFTSLFGVVLIFFIFLLDDEILSHKNYYQTFFVLFGAHFLLTFILRFILTSRVVKSIHRGEIGFPTLIVGGNQQAVDLYDELESMPKKSGFRFLGFVQINGSDLLLEDRLPCLGTYHDLPDLIDKKQIEEVIIAMEVIDHNKTGKVLSVLEGKNVIVKIIPDMYDILSGSVKMTSIFGTPLIQINQEIMPPWQFGIKRVMDIGFSLLALILLSPLYLAIAIAIKFTSEGSIFFVQERIGLHGKPFKIIKFRTMCKNAEKDGPQLSSTHDDRITPIGRFLRKTRLDELPQFWNVIKGDMSLVGPRPERAYFIEKITEEAPHYRHLHKVRPGITSWGQVKYGYAENVEQMIQRLKYDILYIENMSIAIDIKILLYTIIIVFKGSGK
jgi:exopolysaccharide biosynthesis polyprenyl glycosylphosphotransferase